MKKILFILILLIPYIIYAEYDESKVTIESFTLVDTEGYGKELSNPTIDNNGISFNIQVSNKGDSVTYQLVIKNESGEDVELYNRSSADDYVKYILISPTSDYVVKNGQENSFQIKAIYDSPISTTLLQSNNYTNSYTYSLEVSNELGKQDIVHALADVPDTVDNPNTNATLNYVITIASIAFVISIGLWLNIRKKNNIGKVFIIIGMIGIITPIIVYAFKEFKLNLKANVTITKPIQPVCKKATTLHTKTCEATTLGCGKTIGTGNTITYGILSDGSLKPGTAYDCDVNNDGVYNPETERFYYVTKEDNKALLIYYSNMNDQTVYAYDESGENWHGPRTAYQYLPSTTEWSNPNLIAPGTRQITNNEGTLTTNDRNENPQTIESFTYTNRAARLITYQEIIAGCPAYKPSENYFNSCEYLLENIGYYEKADGERARGYLLETPQKNSNYSYLMYGGFASLLAHPTNSVDNGVRPLITVELSNIEYDSETSTSTNEDNQEPDTPNEPVTPICKRVKTASELHTETCNYDNTNGKCAAEEGQGNTITYGVIWDRTGEIPTGAAFDCDVTGDGNYDERFYYVSKYYDNDTQSFDNQTAVLMNYSYYIHSEKAIGNISYAVQEDLTAAGGDPSAYRLNWYGPVTAYKSMPKDTTNGGTWRSDLLKKKQRKILACADAECTTPSPTTNGGTLPGNGNVPKFDYSGYAGRLLTMQEFRSACYDGSTSLTSTGSLSQKCKFMFEGGSYAYMTVAHTAGGVWLETPVKNSTYEIWFAYNFYRRMQKDMSDICWYGIKPVIDLDLYYISTE